MVEWGKAVDRGKFSYSLVVIWMSICRKGGFPVCPNIFQMDFKKTKKAL